MFLYSLQQNSISIEAQIMKHQVHWAGHCVRMKDSCIPKQVFYCQLSHGKRCQGGQRKHFKNIWSWKCTSWEDTDPASWEVLAEDWLEWRLTVCQAVTHFEKDRLKQESARRLRGKTRAQQPGRATLPVTNICHICGRASRQGSNQTWSVTLELTIPYIINFSLFISVLPR